MTAVFSPEAISFEPCELRDIPAITAIYAKAVRFGTASFELEPPTEAEMAARREALVAAGYPYLVARLQGEVAGYAYAGAYRARPAYRGTVESSVYVRDDAQGRGVGSGLLAGLIHEAEIRGFRQMVAVIGDSANLTSRRLHEKLGFELVGILKAVGWRHQRWLDTVLMQRAIGPGDTIAGERR
ncbi:GNAT family N-acetyltransferase [Sinorhizobium garamanticum]|uniref:GNAT family N-acetyltransferase n=1 Tax=Sinorhizobium garamanticum TaxID=680247 RepID=A0ABY8DK50_9HYPH|nr:GNAT family N-acetyltransferase [Sinorhizobium garamanticum]WEX89905.1 GNAT family N-acetyltransferase [Sinorhizobium garamanticum]